MGSRSVGSAVECDRDGRDLIVDDDPVAGSTSWASTGWAAVPGAAVPSRSSTALVPDDCGGPAMGTAMFRALAAGAGVTG